MPTLTPTKDTGATAKANEVVYVELEQTETDEGLANQLDVQGVDASFVADLLSACLTHERCGTHLYRSAANRTANPVLQAAYERFGQQTARHVEILEAVVTAAGGNPSYVSPLARATEAAHTKALEATYLGSGGLNPTAAEMAMLDAVFMAETVDHANWETLGQLAGALPEGRARDALTEAVREVEADDEHLSWAHDTRAQLTMLQVTSSTGTTATASAEELLARVEGWFGATDRTIGDADDEPEKSAARKKGSRAKKKPAVKKSSSKKKAPAPAAKKSSSKKKAPAKKKASAKKARSSGKKATAKKRSSPKK